MSYITIYCEPHDGSARRIYVKNYQTDEILATALEKAVREARELCRPGKYELDVHLRQSP
jgi:hypothetical protein